MGAGRARCCSALGRRYFIDASCVTIDHVVVDFGRGTFVPGQAYVALSRCTSMDDLVLRRPLEPRHVFMDARITTFLRADPDEQTPPRLV